MHIFLMKKIIDLLYNTSIPLKIVHIITIMNLSYRCAGDHDSLIAEDDQMMFAKQREKNHNKENNEQ